MRSRGSSRGNVVRQVDLGCKSACDYRSCFSSVGEGGQLAANRRRYPRLNVPVYFRPARFRTARRPVVDIGLGGLRVYSDEALPLGERLDIELLLPDEVVLNCVVRVAWINALHNGDPAAFDVGLELLDAHGDGLSHLSDLLSGM